MKKLLLIYVFLLISYFLYMYDYHFNESHLSHIEKIQRESQEGISEKYVMVTFQSGIDYWKSSLKGFEDAAQKLNVSVEYRGATQHDIHEQITVLEQVIAKKPAGIAISAIDPDALSNTFEKAKDAGIPIVLFDSGAPSDNVSSFLGTDNYKAGITAAHKLVELMGGTGKVAVITSPNQLNHQERTKGFLDTVKKTAGIKVIAVKDGKGDQFVSSKVAMDLLKKHPDLKGIFATEANGGVGVGEAVGLLKRNQKVKIVSFDTDKPTLDLIKDGTISATLAQGTWRMGFWSLLFLFDLQHKNFPIIKREFSDQPQMTSSVDTGISIVTKENVENYYAK
ncbi:substrate-binding domain-containing protein [Bacillus sp. sid0103]|uniref:substrate-binding domain-containing protein n=1 Tax=Bacillus sp. sid0103 TaxID=2856337 RepID=UPI001C4535C7|nr:substrate-binding domain-containing protein [Bacillus sp. sid0103]MBV7505600.1 substrate-binding domain-containing protein [Bacillus sp. sid0103]